MVNYKFSVIVADDEKLIAKNIAANIKRANPAFEVTGIVGDGQEAYKLTKNLLPDVVFCDIKMPVMNGIELITNISENIPSVKTVIISGYSDFQFTHAAIQQRASDYLLKPVSSADLQNTLQKLERELLATKNELSTCCRNSADIVESVKAYLRYNYNTNIKFTDIASEYGFSSAYLSHIFNKHTGTSLGKYLKEYRINIAKKYLQGSNLQVSEIANKVGFIDQFYFSKFFKKEVGTSPMQYREQTKRATESTKNLYEMTLPDIDL